VVLSADINRMLYVLHNVIGPGLAVLPEKRHEINADNAAALGNQAQFFIGLVAGQVGDGAATGMGNCDRRRKGGGGRLPGGRFL